MTFSDYYSGGFNEETSDQWNDRIREEMNFKRRKQGHSQERQPSQSSSKGRQSEADAKLKIARDEMQKQYETKWKEHQARDNLLRKKKYLAKLEKLYSNTQDLIYSYEDIPWPSAQEDISNLLFCDVEAEDIDTRRKLVREQQIRWHPDKFIQKIGSKLLEKDREKILNKVKEISQSLNNLSDKIA